MSKNKAKYPRCLSLLMSAGLLTQTEAAMPEVAPLDPFLESVQQWSLSGCTSDDQPGIRLAVGALTNPGEYAIAVLADPGSSSACASLNLLLPLNNGWTTRELFWTEQGKSVPINQVVISDVVSASGNQTSDGIDDILLSTQWYPESGVPVGAVAYVSGGEALYSDCSLPPTQAGTAGTCAGNLLPGPSSFPGFGLDLALLDLSGTVPMIGVLAQSSVALFDLDDFLNGDAPTGPALTIDTTPDSALTTLLFHNLLSSDGPELLIGGAGPPALFSCSTGNILAALLAQGPILACSALEGPSIASSGDISALAPATSTSILVGDQLANVALEVVGPDSQGGSVSATAFPNLSDSAGAGAAVLSVDLDPSDTDRSPERIISSIDFNQDDDSVVHIFSVVQNGDGTSSFVERVRYSDDAFRNKYGVHSLLGTALAALPNACTASGRAAPGLLVSAPNAIVQKPSKSINAPLLLLCPQDHIDWDEDGSPASTDCNDRNSSISPKASETCDNTDNNCDGLIDEASGYIDGDGDGYGAEAATSICPTGTKVVTLSGDCDDSNGNVNPGAKEVCDLLDNNCDGTKDEGFDQDLDGYSSCSTPVDCKPKDASTHPGAPELCDGEDNNCDDTVPPDEADADGDSFLVCQEGEACDQGGEFNPNAPELCDGIDNNCNRKIDDDLPDSDSDGFSDCAEEDRFLLSDAGVQAADGCADDPSRSPLKTEVCDTLDNDCDNLADEGFDQDTDGFSDCSGDCDDEDPDVYPDAPELCNGLDDDCDHQDDLQDGFDLNQDHTLDCLDDDADGTLECAGACDLPSDAPPTCTGTAEDPSAPLCDCNDRSSLIYPGALESQSWSSGVPLPDGLDNDCDGLVDEGTATSDDDGDGTCELEPCQPDADGHPLPAGDCDDTQPATYPGAPEGPLNESDGVLEADGLDNDCDGLIDEGTRAFDDDGDGYCELPAADPPSDQSSCARTASGNIPLPGDCDDASSLRAPSLPEGTDADGIDSDCDGLVDEGTLQDDQDGDGFCTEGPCIRTTTDPVGSDPASSDPVGSDPVGSDPESSLPLPGDCDDQDDQTWPGASEGTASPEGGLDADGKDNDCDDLIDEGTRAFDDDGDNHCELTLEQGPCARAPDGHQFEPGDCNDSNPRVHPNALELPCNGLSEDCDPQGLDGTDANQNAILDECDQDGDGYSEGGTQTMPAPGDCNDQDPEIHPGALELCAPGDENCDGLEELGACPSCSVTAFPPNTQLSSRLGTLGLMMTGLASLLLRRRRLRHAIALQNRRSALPRSSPRRAAQHTGMRTGLLTGTRWPDLRVLCILPLIVCASPHVATAGECASPLKASELETALSQLKELSRTLEFTQVISTVDALLERIPCLDGPLKRDVLAGLYAHRAVARWLGQSNQDLLASDMVQALTLSPELELSALGIRQQQVITEQYGKAARAVLSPQATLLLERRTGVQLWVDGLPLEASLKVAPGQHLFQVGTSEGLLCSSMESVPLIRGTDFSMVVRPEKTLEKTLEKTAETRRPCGWTVRLSEQPGWTAAHTALSVTGALGAASALSLVALQQTYAQLEQKATVGEVCSDAENQALCDGFAQGKLRTWVLIGTTAAAAGITAGLTLSLPAGGRAMLLPDAHGLTAQLSWPL